MITAKHYIGITLSAILLITCNLVTFSQTSEYNYATGNVEGRDHVGGLIGRASERDIQHSDNKNTGAINSGSEQEMVDISNSYARGNVTGNNHVGGFIGSSQSGIKHCYSTGQAHGNDHIGGFAGSSNKQVTNSYWNMETSTHHASAGGNGRQTSSMTYPYAGNTFVDWDFNHVWVADASYQNNEGYPYLMSGDVYLLTLRVDPPGSGTATGTGYYKSSIPADLNATPNEGYEFAGWYQDGILLNNNPVFSFNIQGHSTLVARFQESVTSVPEKLRNTKLKIYPNPAQSIVWIELSTAASEAVDIRIINLMGQVLATQHLAANKEITTSFQLDGLRPGMYLILVEGKSTQLMDKLIIR